MRPHFARVTLAVLCVALPVCLAGTQEPPAAKPPAPAKTPELAAQIELLETYVRFEANGDSRKEVHARVHINNEFGVPQFARLNFDYNRSFQQVEIPLVRITHASGGTAEILPGAITDQPNPAVVNAPAYQDVRVKSVRILGLAPGDNLEYRVITTTTHHPLAPDFWLDHTFDRSGVVSHEIFELDLPASRTPQMKVSSATPISSQSETSEGDSRYHVYMWNLTPSELSQNQSDMPNSASEADLSITSFSSWAQLSQRIGPLVNTGFSTQIWEDTKKLMGYPRGPLSDRALYDFVRTKIATIDLPLDFSRLPARPASEVLTSRYGRPEEKIELLFILTIQQHVTGDQLHGRIVAFTELRHPEEHLPLPSLLKGLLLVLPETKSEIYLDPALEVAPFGVIRPDLRDKKALTLERCSGEGKSCWITISGDAPFHSFQHVNVDATLSADGTLTSKVHYAMRGDNELLLRVAFHQVARDKWNEVAQLLALSDGFRGKVTRVTASDPYDTKNPFTVEYEITQPKFVDWSKTPVRIPALLPVVGLPSPSANADAGGTSSGSQPGAIELGTPLDVDTRVTLHLPPETSAEVPTGTSVARDYAKFASEYTVNGATITASRHLTFLLREVAASRATDYNAFVRAVQTDEAQEFRLSRAPSETKPGSKAP